MQNVANLPPTSFSVYTTILLRISRKVNINCIFIDIYDLHRLTEFVTLALGGNDICFSRRHIIKSVIAERRRVGVSHISASVRQTNQNIFDAASGCRHRASRNRDGRGGRGKRGKLTVGSRNRRRAVVKLKRVGIVRRVDK